MTTRRGRTRLTRLFADSLPENPRLLDLAAGTGANLRYLAPRIGRAGQRWVLADHDPGTSRCRRGRDGAVAASSPLPWNAGRSIWSTISAASTPLISTASSPPPCSTLCRPIGPSTSPHGWVRPPGLFCSPSASMAGSTGRRKIRPTPLCAAGSKPIRRRTRASAPPWVRHAPALLAELLEAHGYDVFTEESDWIIGADDAAMHQGADRRLQDGGTGNRTGQCAPTPSTAGHSGGWMHAERGALTALVGHVDIFARPR